MSAVFILDAKRTPVANRDGALSHLQAWQLASAVINSLLKKNGVGKTAVDHLIMGNALYGGGNPARLAALHAGLPDSTPAITLDSQCCGGMDAISLGAQMIRAGSAHVVIAGGLESWSRAPLRYHRPLGQPPAAYERPPFSPWPQNDPDMLDAAAALAVQRKTPRQKQEAYAIQSHKKARESGPAKGLIALEGLDKDEYTRDLSSRLCNRLPAVVGTEPYALSAATIAAQSDASALLLLMSEQALAKYSQQTHVVRLLGALSGGGDPSQPAIAPIQVAKQLLIKHRISAPDVYSAQVMEAFAVQAMAFIEELSLDPTRCNTSGGALSRGHPIAASGAIEVLNAYHALQQAPKNAISLCAIAAAGGLGSAMLLERT